MTTSKVVPAKAKDDFWAVVEDCLREFHGMKPEAIRRKARKLRNAIEALKSTEIESFYHSEPFDVAGDIADAPLSVEAYLDRYLQIRDEKHGNGISRQSAHRPGEAHLKE